MISAPSTGTSSPRHPRRRAVQHRTAGPPAGPRQRRLGPRGGPGLCREAGRQGADMQATGEPAEARASERSSKRGWPLWEVFVRARRGLAHNHVGSLHAPDATMALHSARDVYTRRGEGVSIWVVPSAAIVASSPDEKDAFFDRPRTRSTGTRLSTTCRRGRADMSGPRTCRRCSYALGLGDDALILGHRLAEWSPGAPDRRGRRPGQHRARPAGQARTFLTTPASLKARTATRTTSHTSATSTNSGSAAGRDPNGDFGLAMARQLLFSAYQYALYTALLDVVDATFAAIAERRSKKWPTIVNAHLGDPAGRRHG